MPTAKPRSRLYNGLMQILNGWTQDDLSRRFPQLELGPTRWGILEPDSGVLLARRAVQAVVAQAQENGVEYVAEAIAPPQIGQPVQRLSGKEIKAGQFVFACGPWLPKLFPELLRDLIHVTRQEVIFFGVPPGDDSFSRGVMPAWIDFNDLVYGCRMWMVAGSRSRSTRMGRSSILIVGREWLVLMG